MPFFSRRRSPANHAFRTTRRGVGGKLRSVFRGNGRTTRQNRVAGLKAARTNPNTTSQGRKRAKVELHSMGVRANHVPFSTRVRHFFHLGGRTRRSRKV